MPASTGLPNRKVVASGLLILLAAWVLLVLTSINGTSSGMFYSSFFTGTDPALLLGSPNPLRSDEWNVQTVWAIAQLQQGLPAVNGTLPGGMDTTLPQDLPRLDWTVAFRPHLWGFFLLDADRGQSWKWWLPLFGLMAAGYLFCLMFLPAKPMLAMLLSVGLGASPFFQWWFLQTTLWPVAWGLAVAAGTYWLVHDPRIRTRIAWLLVIGYLTVVVGMGIYVPYIIPVVVVTAAAVIGIAIQRTRVSGWRTVVRPLVWLIGSGLAAGVVLGVWLVTRWETVQEFLSTAYPGERLESTGAGANGASLASILGSSFVGLLKSEGGLFGANAPESASFFLPGLFLLPLLIWLVIQRRRARQGLPWTMILVYGSAIVLLAFIFIPGWDAIAHLLLLDRGAATRMRIGLGFASFLLLVLFMSKITRSHRPGWIIGCVPALAFLAAQAAAALWLERTYPGVLARHFSWVVVAAASAAALFAVARGWRLVAAVLVLAVAVAGSLGVNPLYLGVFDLRETSASAAVRAVDDADAGAWVGLGSNVTTALLLESGVEAYNGFQGAPDPDMWSAIDPDGTFEEEWNRLAGISWEVGDGDPVVTNPYADQILVSFDACSAFAQSNVTYVLSDDTQQPDGDCLERIEDVQIPRTDLVIWRVVAPS